MPGVQEAMNASASGDTILVASGTWVGRYETPTHSLTLTSHYMFSGDSAHINETILDGEDVGTILMIRTIPENQFTLTGFTMMRGLGQQTDIWANCFIGGAIHTDQGGDVVITDMLFTQNHAPRAGAVFLQLEICWGAVEGNLVMERVNIFNNTTEHPSILNGNVCVKQSDGDKLVVKDFYFDGLGSVEHPFTLSVSLCDSLILDNIHIRNANGINMHIGGSFRNNASVSNVSISSEDGMKGGDLVCNMGQIEPFVRDTLFIRNIEFSGNVNKSAFIANCYDSLVLITDSIYIHDNLNCGTRGPGDGENLVRFKSVSTRSSISNLLVENNTAGDSVNLHSYGLVSCYGTSLYNSVFRNNRVMSPVQPLENHDISVYMGHIVSMSLMVQYQEPQHLRAHDLLFENNLLEDLNDYSDNMPDNLYPSDFGREFDMRGRKNVRNTASNIIIRNSRHHNMIPEVTTPTGVGVSIPQGAMSIGGFSSSLDNILIENCDGAGLLFIGDSLQVDNMIVRNVERQGIASYVLTRYPELGDVPGFVRLRNVLIDSVEGQASFLPADMASQSPQAALYLGVWGQYLSDSLFQVDLENVTITNCNELRHLVNLRTPLALNVKNSIFANNTVETFIEAPYELREDWSYSLLPEVRPGEGNLIAVDPMFDMELGVPFLSETSPCIDAGDPNPEFNDPEDPLNPSFALWPSLGSVRNDIGYTGGPGSISIDTSWVDIQVDPRTLRPATFRLEPPYPNPFNPVTQIPFTLLQPAEIELTIYDLLGRKMTTLVGGSMHAGAHVVPFHGGGLASGMYLAVLMVDGEQVDVTKMLLVK
jgi:hypothetical protein